MVSLRFAISGGLINKISKDIKRYLKISKDIQDSPKTYSDDLKKLMCGKDEEFKDL